MHSKTLEENTDSSFVNMRHVNMCTMIPFDLARQSTLAVLLDWAYCKDGLGCCVTLAGPGCESTAVIGCVGVCLPAGAAH